MLDKEIWVIALHTSCLTHCTLFKGCWGIFFCMSSKDLVFRACALQAQEKKCTEARWYLLFSNAKVHAQSLQLNGAPRQLMQPLAVVLNR